MSATEYDAAFLRLTAPLRRVSLLSEDMSPSEVFHYTDKRGLEGILKDGFFRASNFRTLNDTSEYQYAAQKAKDLVDGMERSTKVRRRLLETVSNVLRDHWRPELYVASFCVESDLLSMWRGYSSVERGRFAIGLQVDHLHPDGDDPKIIHGPWQTGPVAYSDQQQERWLFRGFDEMVEGLTDEHASRLEEIGLFLSSRILPSLPFLKHPYFRDEREWRAVLDCQDFAKTKADQDSGRVYVEYRPRSMSEGSLLPITKVVVGPTPGQNAAEVYAHHLLTKHGYRDVAVENVPRPLKDW